MQLSLPESFAPRIRLEMVGDSFVEDEYMYKVALYVKDEMLSLQTWMLKFTPNSEMFTLNTSTRPTMDPATLKVERLYYFGLPLGDIGNTYVSWSRENSWGNTWS